MKNNLTKHTKLLTTAKYLNIMEYNGYVIEPNNTGYVNYDFYKSDDELISGNGETIEDCKRQINELINE